MPISTTMSVLLTPLHKITPLTLKCLTNHSITPILQTAIHIPINGRSERGEVFLVELITIPPYSFYNGESVKHIIKFLIHYRVFLLQILHNVRIREILLLTQIPTLLKPIQRVFRVVNLIVDIRGKGRTTGVAHSCVFV